MNPDTLSKLQAASKILEAAHIVDGSSREAFDQAATLVGHDVACALLVAIKRAENGSLELFPAPEHIDHTVKHALAHEGILQA